MALDELSVGARAAIFATSICTLGAFGCDREIERPGQLIIAVDTDMAIPQQVDTLHVQVEIGGQIEYRRPFEVGPRSPELLPATLTLYDEGDPRQDPVTVKIAGSKAGPNGLEWRTYREATMPIPRGRVATLRMPVQWLCKGTAEAVPDSGDPLEEPSAQSTCGTGFTCRAGHCEESEVEEPLLPDYKPQDIFGGGATPEEGSCFDTVGCMTTGRAVTPDDNCQIELPEGERFNVALRVVNDGICDASGVNCFVPLDGRSPEGWMLADDRVQLPAAVCTKLDEGLVRAVLVSDACDVKTEGVPACGPWSSVSKGRAGQYRPDSGVRPSATLLTTLPTDTDATRCCPLMAADDKLYTCVCTGTTNATVFEIDPAEGSPLRVGTLNPENTRGEPLAASVFDGSLYWAAGREIRRTPLGESDALASSFGVPAPAALYQTGSLLADATHIYALASGGAASGEASVQLFSIVRDRSSAPVSIPAGDVPVYQFDHDDEAVYLALDRDENTDQGLRRTSSVVRIEKQNGLRNVLMPERTLELTTSERGGYIGVRIDDGIVYALYEAVEAGNFRVELHTLRANASSGEPQIRYEAPIDPTRTRLRLLGVAGGGVLISQFELNEDESVKSASIVAIPAGAGEPRFIADFANDHPADGIGKNQTHVFWLNASGAVYALPRSLLE